MIVDSDQSQTQHIVSLMTEDATADHKTIIAGDHSPSALSEMTILRDKIAKELALDAVERMEPKSREMLSEIYARLDALIRYSFYVNAARTDVLWPEFVVVQIRRLHQTIESKDKKFQNETEWNAYAKAVERQIAPTHEWAVDRCDWIGKLTQQLALNAQEKAAKVSSGFYTNPYPSDRATVNFDPPRF